MNKEPSLGDRKGKRPLLKDPHSLVTSGRVLDYLMLQQHQRHHTLQLQKRGPQLAVHAAPVEQPVGVQEVDVGKDEDRHVISSSNNSADYAVIKTLGQY